jgi:hypothetical protein
MMKRQTEGRTEDDHNIERKENQKDKLKEEQRNRGTNRTGFFFTGLGKCFSGKLALTANNFQFMCSQKNLAKPHSQISTKYLQIENKFLTGIMIFCIEVQY